MPVTSLPIYGLRNRAGPGGFLPSHGRFAYGLGSADSAGLATPGSQTAGTSGVQGARPEPQSRCGAQGPAGSGAPRESSSGHGGRACGSSLRRCLPERGGIPVLGGFPKKAKIRYRRLRLPSPCLGAIPEN